MRFSDFDAYMIPILDLWGTTEKVRWDKENNINFMWALHGGDLYRGPVDFARLDNGKYDLAIADFTKAIELNPRLALAYLNRGLAYASKGQFDLAITDFTKVIELNPRLAIAYYKRGVAYADGKGQFDHAIADCTTAIELNPRYVEAYYSRGFVHRILPVELGSYIGLIELLLLYLSQIGIYFL